MRFYVDVDTQHVYTDSEVTASYEADMAQRAEDGAAIQSFGEWLEVSIATLGWTSWTSTSSDCEP